VLPRSHNRRQVRTFLRSAWECGICGPGRCDDLRGGRWRAWQATTFRDGGCIDPKPCDAPSLANPDESQIVANAQGPSQELAAQTQPASIELWGSAGRRWHRQNKSAEVRPQAAKSSEYRCEPRLIEAFSESRRSEIAQHGIVSRLIGMLDRHDRGFCQGRRAFCIDGRKRSARHPARFSSRFGCDDAVGLVIAQTDNAEANRYAEAYPRRNVSHRNGGGIL